MKHSVDAICKYGAGFVIIERLSYPVGLAFPGGKVEKGEDESEAITRELFEETGLTFAIDSWLEKTYNEPGRDPRGPMSTRVAVGEGFGTLQNEEGKTKVHILTKEEIIKRESEFAFDHFQIFTDYCSLLQNP